MKSHVRLHLATTLAAAFAALLPPARAVDAPALPAVIDLDTALSLALEHNYAIRQARARHAEATGALTESRAGHLPTLSVNSDYSEIDEGLLESLNGQTFGSTRSWSAGVQVQQLLYTGGAVESGIRRAREAREAAVQDYRASVQTALLNVRERFFDVLLAREQVIVQEEALRLLQEELDDARARVRAGSGSPFDELRAEVAVANGRPPLIRARNTYRLAAVELLRAVGLPAEEGIEDRVQGELAFEPIPYDLEELLIAAHENRPEITELEHRVAAAEHAIDNARAGLRPTVSAAAGYGVQKSTFSDDLDDTVDGWTIGVQGTWNIWDGNATRGRVAQARAQLQQARLTLHEVALAVDAEVRRAYSDYQEAEELVTASQRVVEQAEESLRLARSRLDAGAATQLDVLQAQVALTDARTNAALALHGANVARARLERAAALTSIPDAARLER